MKVFYMPPASRVDIIILFSLYFLSALAKPSIEEEGSQAEAKVEAERKKLIEFVRAKHPRADLQQGVPLNFHWAILQNLRR